MALIAFLGGVLCTAGVVFMIYRPTLDRTRDGELLLWYTPTDDRTQRRYINL